MGWGVKGKRGVGREWGERWRGGGVREGDEQTIRDEKKGEKKVSGRSLLTRSYQHPSDT
jgi:hypothetical protein